MPLSPQDRTDDPISVLHVDDDREFGELTATYLERIDDQFSIETASDVDEGLELVAEGQFDCIVSDFDMPGQNGIQFLETVRGEDLLIPFILFTGKGSEEVASEAITAGVTDYLQKQSGTSQYEVLANRIRNAVNRTRASQAVRETEEWATRLLEYSSDYVFVVNENGNTKYVSPAVERVLGYGPAEVTGEPAFETIHPDDIETANDAFSATIGTPNEDVTAEFRAQHADGGYRWLEVRGRNLLDDPFIKGILVNARDITIRKHHEQALQQNQERFRSIAEAASDVILTIDTESVIKFANPAAKRVFGYEPAELQGEPVTMLMPDQLGEQHRNAMARYLATSEPTLDWTGVNFTGRHKDGHEIDLEISFSELEWNGRHRFTGIIRRRDD